MEWLSRFHLLASKITFSDEKFSTFGIMRRLASKTISGEVCRTYKFDEGEGFMKDTTVKKDEMCTRSKKSMICGVRLAFLVSAQLVLGRQRQRSHSEEGQTSVCCRRHLLGSPVHPGRVLRHRFSHGQRWALPSFGLDLFYYRSLPSRTNYQRKQTLLEQRIWSNGALQEL